MATYTGRSDQRDFEIEVAPDVFVTGTAAMPAPDYAHISRIDVTADAAALFAQWLRDSGDRSRDGRSPDSG